MAMALAILAIDLFASEWIGPGPLGCPAMRLELVNYSADYPHSIAQDYTDNLSCSSSTLSHSDLLAANSVDVDRRFVAGTIALCFVFFELFEDGNTGGWFWSLYETVFTKAPFYVHAVQVKALHSWSAFMRLRRAGVHFNPSDFDLLRHCDVLLQTGTPPLRSWGKHRLVPRIMVVHENPEPNDDGMGKTEYAGHYDAVVAVSPFGIEVVPELYKGVREHIPPAIPRCHSDMAHSATEVRRQWGLPLDKKVMLLFGFVRTKDTQATVHSCHADTFPNPEAKLKFQYETAEYLKEVLSHLSPDWVGAIAGRGMRTQCLTVPRLHVLEGAHSPRILQVADVVLLPHLKGNSNLLLLEAWGARKPVFALPLGWASPRLNESQGNIFSIQGPEGGDVLADPERVAQQVESVYNDLQQPDSEASEAVRKNLLNVMDRHQLKDLAPQWARVLLQTLTVKMQEEQSVHLDLKPLNVGQGIMVSQQQKSHCFQAQSKVREIARISITRYFALEKVPDQGSGCFSLIIGWDLFPAASIDMGNASVVFSWPKDTKEQTLRTVHFQGGVKDHPLRNQRSMLHNIAYPYGARSVDFVIRLPPKVRWCVWELILQNPRWMPTMRCEVT